MLKTSDRVVTYDLEWGTIERVHEGTATQVRLFDVRTDEGRVLQFVETRLVKRHPFGDLDPKTAA
jgi:hypothetical protein